MKKQLQIHKAVLILFAGLILTTSMSGCKNTAHGAGKDIEEAGEKIQEKTD